MVGGTFVIKQQSTPVPVPVVPVQATLYDQLKSSIAQHHREHIGPIEEHVLFLHGDPQYKSWLGGDREIFCGGRNHDVKYGFQPYQRALEIWNVQQGRYGLYRNKHGLDNKIKPLSNQSSEQELQAGFEEWRNSLVGFHQCITPLSLVVPKTKLDKIETNDDFHLSVEFADKIHDWQSKH